MECLETSEHSIMPYGTGAVSKTTPLLYCDNGRIHDIACFLNNCASHPLPGLGPHLKLTRHDMVFSQTRYRVTFNWQTTNAYNRMHRNATPYHEIAIIRRLILLSLHIPWPSTMFESSSLLQINALHLLLFIDAQEWSHETTAAHMQPCADHCLASRSTHTISMEIHQFEHWITVHTS